MSLRGRRQRLHSGACGPFCLCGSGHLRFTQLQIFQVNHAACILKFEVVGPTKCICGRCAEDAQKGIGQDEYHPVRTKEGQDTCMWIAVMS